MASEVGPAEEVIHMFSHFGTSWGPQAKKIQNTRLKNYLLVSFPFSWTRNTTLDFIHL